MEYIDYGRILNDAHSFATRHNLDTDIFISENHDRNIKIIKECIETHPYFNGKETIRGLIDIYYRTSVYKKTLDDVANNLNISYDHAKKLRKSIIRNITSLLELDITDVEDLISIDDTRLFNILIKNGYVRNSDLDGISYDDFSNIKDFGQKSWLRLKEYMDMKNIPYVKDNIGIEEIDVIKDFIRNNVSEDENLSDGDIITLKSLLLLYLKNTYTELTNSISFNLFKDPKDPMYQSIVGNIADSLIDIELIKEFYNITDSMIKEHYKLKVSGRKDRLLQVIQMNERSKDKKKQSEDQIVDSNEIEKIRRKMKKGKKKK